MADETHQGAAYCHRCGAESARGMGFDAGDEAENRACPLCGRRYSAEYRFCPYDGRPVSPCAKSDAQISASLLLRVLRGTANQEVIELIDGEHVLGRDVNECSVVARLDPYLNPRHACISVVEGRLTVNDLASENGTFLRCDSPQSLWHGAQLLVGTTVLQVELPSCPPLPNPVDDGESVALDTTEL